MEGAGAARAGQPRRHRVCSGGGRRQVTMPIGIFAFLAALAVIAACGVIMQRNPIHCVLALALVLADLGVLFMGLGAVTLGFLQIIVYVGAIMVLFLFVIWLLNIQADPGMGGSL